MKIIKANEILEINEGEKCKEAFSYPFVFVRSNDGRLAILKARTILWGKQIMDDLSHSNVRKTEGSVDCTARYIFIIHRGRKLRWPEFVLNGFLANSEMYGVTKQAIEDVISGKSDTLVIPNTCSIELHQPLD